jgi:hypothetical protein
LAAPSVGGSRIGALMERWRRLSAVGDRSMT